MSGSGGFSRVQLEPLSPPTASSSHTLTTESPNIPDSQVTEIRRYEDFSTIDWVEDSARENRLRLRTLQEVYSRGNRARVNNNTRTSRSRSRSFNRNRHGDDDTTNDDIDDFNDNDHSSKFSFGKKLSQNGAKYVLVLEKMYSAGQSWLVLALVGIMIGLIAAFLSIVTQLLSDFKTGYCSAGLYLNQNFCCSGYDEYDLCPEWYHWTSFGPVNYIIYIIFSSFFAFVAALFVYSFAPYAAGSGISEIKCIIAGFVMNGFLDAKTLFIKSFTLPLTIASGLSVGKEGPSVHYAVCAGNTIAGLFPKYRLYNSKMREVLSACAAAGVAVAFGSPMGGVLFSLEEMSSSFQLKTMWRSYFCALVATGVLASLNPFRTGQLVLFSVKYDHDWHFFEIIFFIIIGLFGGFGGMFIIKWNLRAQAFRKKYLAPYPIQEVVILATITAIICYFNEFLRIDMTESMQILFHECDHGWENITCQGLPTNKFYIAISLFTGVIIRTILTIISYGSKVPAGIFVPSMAIGALFGRLVGTVAWWLHDKYPDASFFASCPPDTPCITPGTYALLGSAALLSGVMNITVTVVIIAFEVTGALRYILPTMIVVGVTKAVGDYFGPGGGGIADRTITANGYPYLEEHDFEVHSDDPIELAMTSDLITIASTGWTVLQIQTLLSNGIHQSYPIIDSNEKFLVGYIWRSELEYIVNHNRDTPDKFISFDDRGRSKNNNDDQNFSRLVNVSPVTVQYNTPLSKVVALFSKLGPRVVYVENGGILCGLLTRKDILKYQHKADYAMLPPRDTTAAEEMDRKLWELIVQVGTRITQLVRRR